MLLHERLSFACALAVDADDEWEAGGLMLARLERLGRIKIPQYLEY